MTRALSPALLERALAAAPPGHEVEVRALPGGVSVIYRPAQPSEQVKPDLAQIVAARIAAKAKG